MSEFALYVQQHFWVTGLSNLFMNYLPIAAVGALYVSGCQRRGGFVFRLCACVLLCALNISLFVLAELAARLYLQAYYIPVALLGFCAMYLFISFALWFCCRISFLEALSCAAIGYTLQNMAWKVYAFFLHAFDAFEAVKENSLLFWGVMLAVSGAGVFVLWLIHAARRGRAAREVRVAQDGKTFAFVIAVLAVVIVLSYVCDVYYRQDKVLYLSSCLLFALTCAFIFAVQFGKVRLSQKDETLRLQERMLELERRQYEQLRENVSVINLKCHDLKHQLLRLKAGRAGVEGDRFIAEMEQAIRGFEVDPATGNEAIDTAVAEKWMLCNAKGISFSCVVDGKALSFMEEGDLFSLFGNALDNAVEASAAMEEGKRVVSVTTCRRGNFLVLQFQNYYRGELRFCGGLPLTTKKEKEYHGYGTESIRTIVQKYGGSLAIDAGGGIYRLDIAFPLPEQTAKG